MADPVRRYTFQPLERRGVLLGLEAGQLAVIGLAVVLALVLRATVGGPAGGVLGGGTVLVVLAAVLRKREGIPAFTRAALGIVWLGRAGLRRPRLAELPLHDGRPRSRHAEAPHRAGKRWPVGAPPGIELFEDAGIPGDPPVAVIVDRQQGTWAAVIGVRGRPPSLLDPEDQAARLELWRGVLGAMARPGSPIRRVQWVQRSGLAAVDDLQRSVQRLAAGGPGRPPEALDSYRGLVAAAAPTMTDHEAWMVLAIAPPRRRGTGDGPGRSPHQPGGGRTGSGHGASAVRTLRRELRLLDGQLRAADLDPGKPLDLAELTAVLEAGRETRRPRLRAGLASLWALAGDEGWKYARTDGAWHASYWIAEWPRVDVGPAFLVPLLTGAGRRTVSLVMAPVSPDRALREVRASLTADVADAELREKAGFLPSARRQRESEGAARREAELAEGHGEYRFSGYVTVTAADLDGIEAAAAELEHAAQGAHLELRRLYGRQGEALTWTLPLARGLR